MPIGQPRRIFRSGSPPFGIRTFAGLLFATAVGGAVLAVMYLRQAPAPAPVSQAAGLPQELVAQPAQVAVVDSGTLRLSDRVIRLFGVRPPARGTGCEAGERSGVDCAAAATNALAAMVREAPVACRVTGQDSGGRPYAICQAGGTELNRAVIAAGWARADRASTALRDAETAARAGHRGVWAAQRGASW